ncbi:hypothetical protein JTE90_020894 [Oedothorax gibbosus]|uniref:DUF4219 domain-containing protein n=1 Tax=Oedothorax gibbosus TaxID=931172 RepID=A0AAV6U9Y7_9ARAC|nr:hypothetical protein JTE90_020894 [Oedothorax gibbosus]
MALLNPSIAKLNGKNYSLWSIDMKFLLIERGLWKLVSGKETTPAAKEELGNYEDRCDRALSTIYPNISEEYKRLIKTETCPIKAWENLKSYFEPDDRVRHQMIFNEFLECKPNKSEGFAMFFSKIKDLVDQLKDIQHPMDDDRAGYRTPFLHWFRTL